MDSILETIEKFILMHPTFTVFGAITLVQFTPLKINPWTCLFRWLSSIVFGALKAQLAELENKIDANQKMVEEYRAEEMRWDIREFAEGCKHGEHHTREEWRHIIALLERYEDYVVKYDIRNGVIKEETKYLRGLYAERNNKNDF